MKNNKKNNLTDEDRWIDVTDDEVMAAHGLFRPRKAAPRDPSVWTKTPKERRMLKSMRKVHKERMHFNSSLKYIDKIRGKLTINLRKNRKFGKTTYSHECYLYEIPSILTRYSVVSKDGTLFSVIKKYYWNGKTYNTNNLPIGW